MKYTMYLLAIAGIFATQNIHAMYESYELLEALADNHFHNIKVYGLVTRITSDTGNPIYQIKYSWRDGTNTYDDKAICTSKKHDKYHAWDETFDKLPLKNAPKIYYALKRMYYQQQSAFSLNKTYRS